VSQSLGNRLPESVYRRLDGTDLEGDRGFTLSLVTVDESRFPRIALLSVGEVLALGKDRLAIALWPGSTTTRSLTASGQGTLAVVADEVAYSIQIEVQRQTDLPAGGMDHAFFIATIQDVLADEVTYARLTSGITFELPDRERVLARWQATLDAMRARAA
jgi:hypothetical protein